MTYSIIGRDRESGAFGVAVQSRWFAVGGIVPWVEAGVGAVATQAFPELGYGPRGLALMRTGMSASDALDALVSVDPGADRRQLALMDARGGIASYSGRQCVEHYGVCFGDDAVAQGNMLARKGIWDAMVNSFEESGGDLASRLVSALETAEAEGGDIRGAQSSAVIVVAAEASGHPRDVLCDLRVDESDAPIPELRRLLTRSRVYAELGRCIELAIHGSFDAAAQASTAVLEEVPTDDQVAVWNALILVADGRVDEAMPILRRALKEREQWLAFARSFAASGVFKDPEAFHGLLANLSDRAEPTMGAEKLSSTVVHQEGGRMEKLGAYFAGFTGNADWESLQPAFDAAFHRDLVVVTGDGERTREEWVSAVKGLLAQQTKASDFAVSREDSEAIYYRVTLTKGDGTVFHASSRGFFKDGQIVRVEPIDPDAMKNIPKFFGDQPQE